VEEVSSHHGDTLQYLFFFAGFWADFAK